MGAALGCADGLGVCPGGTVGMALGVTEGRAVGPAVVGLAVGASDGSAVGTLVGEATVGAEDGVVVGAAVGIDEGAEVGITVSVLGSIAAGGAREPAQSPRSPPALTGQ